MYPVSTSRRDCSVWGRLLFLSCRELFIVTCDVWKCSWIPHVLSYSTEPLYCSMKLQDTSSCCILISSVNLIEYSVGKAHKMKIFLNYAVHTVLSSYNVTLDIYTDQIRCVNQDAIRLGEICPRVGFLLTKKVKNVKLSRLLQDYLCESFIFWIFNLFTPVYSCAAHKPTYTTLDHAKNGSTSVHTASLLNVLNILSTEKCISTALSS